MQACLVPRHIRRLKYPTARGNVIAPVTKTPPLPLPPACTAIWHASCFDVGTRPLRRGPTHGATMNSYLLLTLIGMLPVAIRLTPLWQTAEKTARRTDPVA